MTSAQEIFLPIPIPEYSQKYSISESGNVLSVKRGIILKQCLRNGYYSVCLSYNAKKRNYLIHRLVAITFIENPNGYGFVNHKDGNKLNNNVSNLEWITSSGNARHSIDTLNNVRSTVPIIQLSKTGNIIQTFQSIKDAEIKTGVSSKHIPSVCTGLRQSAGGFIWNYVNDERVGAPDGRQLIDYPGYIITSNGTIYSLKSKRYLALKTHKSGYVSVTLSNGSKKDFYVHILVASLYLSFVPGKEFVNHKDRNKSNNKIDNLEWVSASENNNHAIATGVNTFKRSVKQYDIYGIELRTFSSVKEASISSGVDSSSIVRVCKNKQSHAGNYIWKYI